MTPPKTPGIKHGVTVQTWGTKSDTSNGMINFADQMLFGGDVGHAKINMTLPITEETKGWIEKYCCDSTFEQYLEKFPDATFEEYFDKVDKNIPVKITRVDVRQAKYDENGKLVPTQEKAHEQVFFEVDFSWWPGRVQTHEQDMYLEREGKHVEYAEKWKEYLQPEQRRHRGKLGSRMMDYAPSSVIHQRDLPDFIAQRLLRKAELNKLEEHAELLERLKSKIPEVEEVQLSGTIKIMFKNLGINDQELMEAFKENFSEEQQNPESFRNFLDNYASNLKNEFSERLDALEEEVTSDLDIEKLNNNAQTTENELSEAKQNLEYYQYRKNDVDKLLQLMNGDENASIPFQSEINSILIQFGWTSYLKLTNGRLSSTSIDNLIQKLEEQIASQQEQDQLNSQGDVKKVQYLDDLLEKHDNDLEAVEDELEWGDEDHPYTLDEMQNAKNRLSNPGEKVVALQTLKQELEQNKETGMDFTDELGQKLDKELKNWRTHLDSPCQNVTAESASELRDIIKEESTHVIEEVKKNQDAIESLEEKLQQTKIDIVKYEQFAKFYEDNVSLYSVIGTPPHHQVKLPFSSDTERGLNPEEMLKKMHEIAVLDDEQFDLYRKNCSLTSIQILTAGAEHDARLKQIMSNKALGFYGTPQQVLTNAVIASDSIAKNQSSNMLSVALNASPLDQAMGYAIKLYMDKEASGLQKAAGISLGSVVGITKTPFIGIRALLNPRKAFDNLTNTVNLVYNRDSTALKVGMGVVSAPALAILAPLAAIQTGTQAIINGASKPIKSIAKSFTDKPESTDVIDVPIGNQEQADVSTTNNTALAKELNSKISTTISENTLSVQDDKNPKIILEAFEQMLKENPDKIVVLEDDAQSRLSAFILKSNDDVVKQRYYDSCFESIKRVNKHQPHTKEEINQAIEQAKSGIEEKKKDSATSHIRSGVRPAQRISRQQQEQLREYRNQRAANSASTSTLQASSDVANSNDKSQSSSKRNFSEQAVVRTIVKSEFNNNDWKEFVILCSKCANDSKFMNIVPLYEQMSRVKLVANFEGTDNNAALNYAVAFILKAMATPANSDIAFAKTEGMQKFLEAFNNDQINSDIREVIYDIVGKENGALNDSDFAAKMSEIEQMSDSVLKNGFDKFALNQQGK